jgi:hypothetical protein
MISCAGDAVEKYRTVSCVPKITMFGNYFVIHISLVLPCLALCRGVVQISNPSEFGRKRF